MPKFEPGTLVKYTNTMFSYWTNKKFTVIQDLGTWFVRARAEEKVGAFNKGDIVCLHVCDLEIINPDNVTVNTEKIPD